MGDISENCLDQNYDDEKSPPEVIDNWDSLLLLDAIREDQKRKTRRLQPRLDDESAQF